MVRGNKIPEGWEKIGKIYSESGKIDIFEEMSGKLKKYTCTSDLIQVQGWKKHSTSMCSQQFFFFGSGVTDLEEGSTPPP